MSIDGIGRPPVPPSGARPVDGAPAAGAGGETFQVQHKTTTGAVEAASSGLLERLERGELSVEQYLDARVDEAVAPFASRLPSEKLDFMRSSLRAELENDPVLVELVRRATTNVPSTEP